MSIFYITGKPRGGKSYLAVEAIYKELCDPASRRFIVTNIALNLASIAEWLQKDGIQHEVNLRQRVRVLTDEETGEFWCYEPGWEFKNRKKIKVNRRGTEIEVPDFSYEDGSVRATPQRTIRERSTSLTRRISSSRPGRGSGRARIAPLSFPAWQDEVRRLHGHAACGPVR